ncbi:hypothetical protein HW132_25020 [Brasilonema sp. CT11]|nr:hypothetical protein [Brasilonema sp. CT11]
MKFQRLFPSLLLSGAILALLTTPVLSQEKSRITLDKTTTSTQQTTRSSPQQASVVNNSPVKPITEIRSLSEIERPLRSARMLVQSPTPQATPPTSEVVQVTDVKANRTSIGVEVILQTTKGQVLQLQNRTIAKSNRKVCNRVNYPPTAFGNRAKPNRGSGDL